MSIKKIATLVVMTSIVGACAKSSKDIPPTYVSPMQYRSYSCDTIEQELMSISRRIATVAGTVDKQASGDTMQATIGLVVFWPALFLLDGDTPQAAEYARLKGEFEALESMARQKECGIEIQKIKPEPKPEEKAKETENKNQFQKTKRKN